MSDKLRNEFSNVFILLQPFFSSYLFFLVLDLNQFSRISRLRHNKELESVLPKSIIHLFHFIKRRETRYAGELILFGHFNS